jgi:hypothetical protein
VPNAHETPATTGRYVFAVTVLVLLSLVTALMVASFVAFVLTPPVDGDGVVGFLVIDIPLLLACASLVRRVRWMRWSRKGRARRTGQVPASQPRVGLAAGRVPWFPRFSTPDETVLTSLERAEQSFGDSCYQLDLSRSTRALTRAQLLALRQTGLRASSVLNELADPFVLNGTPTGVGVLARTTARSRLLVEGIRCYTEFADTAAACLVGNATVAELIAAGERLDRQIESARQAAGAAPPREDPRRR